MDREYYALLEIQEVGPTVSGRCSGKSEGRNQDRAMDDRDRSRFVDPLEEVVEYLTRLIAYIHFNPVRAGLVPGGF